MFKRFAGEIEGGLIPLENSGRFNIPGLFIPPTPYVCDYILKELRSMYFDKVDVECSR
jgi:hypothetical protein